MQGLMDIEQELKGALVKLKNAEGAILAALSSVNKANIQLNHASTTDNSVAPLPPNVVPVPFSPNTAAPGPIPAPSNGKSIVVEMSDSLSNGGTFWCRPFVNEGYNKVFSGMVAKLRSELDVSPVRSQPTADDAVEGSMWACHGATGAVFPRRVVIEKCIPNRPPRYIVRAIDIGNVSEVSLADLWSLPDELANMHPMAFCCCLSGFPLKRFPYEAKWRFRDLTWQRVLRLDICGFTDQETNQPVHVVDLFTTAPTILHINAEVGKAAQEAAKAKMVSPRTTFITSDSKPNEINESLTNDQDDFSTVAKIDASYLSVEPFIPASALVGRNVMDASVSSPQLPPIPMPGYANGGQYVSAYGDLSPPAFNQSTPGPAMPVWDRPPSSSLGRDAMYHNRMQEVRALKETVDKGVGTFFLLVASYHKLMHTYNDGRLFVDQSIGHSMSLAHQLRGASSVYIIFVKTGKQETRLCAVAQVTSILQQKNPRKDTQAHLRFLSVSKVSYEWNEPFANGQEISLPDAHRLLLSLCDEIQMEKSKSLFDVARMPMPVKEPYGRDAWKDTGEPPGFNNVPTQGIDMASQMNPVLPLAGAASEWSTTGLDHNPHRQQRMDQQPLVFEKPVQQQYHQQQQPNRQQQNMNHSAFASFSEATSFYEEDIVDAALLSKGSSNQPLCRSSSQESKYFDVHGNRVRTTPSENETDFPICEGSYLDAMKCDEATAACEMPLSNEWSALVDDVLTPAVGQSPLQMQEGNPGGEMVENSTSNPSQSPDALYESEQETNLNSQFEHLFDDATELEEGLSDDTASSSVHE